MQPVAYARKDVAPTSNHAVWMTCRIASDEMAYLGDREIATLAR